MGTSDAVMAATCNVQRRATRKYILTGMIALALLVWGWTVEAKTVQPLCLRCHPSHYGEKGPCRLCHRGNEGSDRKSIAHSGLIAGRFAWFALPGSPPLERGNRLVEQLACRRCHTVAKSGNTLAANLDVLLERREPREILASIKTPVTAMPDFKLDDGRISDLIISILAGGALRGTQGKETPLVVHFGENARTEKENIFSRRCGLCHKAITSRFGGLGKGEIGPNLSGLFSRFYPHTFRDNEAWDREKLKKWLDNPRRIRGNSVMQPIRLEAAEREKLLEILQMEDDML